MSSPRIAAVIPVLEEEGAIGRVVQALPRDLINEVIVVDGGSRDGTVAEAESAGARVLVERRPGYGRACAAGAAAATSDILLFLDGDGSDPAELAPVLLEPLLQDRCDFVLASRLKSEREAGSMGWHQVLAGRAIGAMVGWLYGTTYVDMRAFRAIRRIDLERLGMCEMTYGWNLEMQMRAARAGLRILEIPLPYRRRIAGQSKVAGTLRGTLKAGYRILATLIRVACQSGDGPLPRRRPG